MFNSLGSQEVSDGVSVEVHLSNSVSDWRYFVVDQIINQLSDVDDEGVLSGDGGSSVLVLVQHLEHSIVKFLIWLWIYDLQKGKKWVACVMIYVFLCHNFARNGKCVSRKATSVVWEMTQVMADYLKTTVVEGREDSDGRVNVLEFSEESSVEVRVHVAVDPVE